MSLPIFVLTPPNTRNDPTTTFWQLEESENEENEASSGRTKIEAAKDALARALSRTTRSWNSKTGYTIWRSSCGAPTTNANPTTNPDTAITITNITYNDTLSQLARLEAGKAMAQQETRKK